MQKKVGMKSKNGEDASGCPKTSNTEMLIRHAELPGMVFLHHLASPREFWGQHVVNWDNLGNF